MDTFPMEYSFTGTGDYRESCFTVLSKGGFRTTELIYDSHEILPFKPGLQGMPASFGDAVTTLLIHLVDKVLNIRVTLAYSVFEDADVIVRSASVQNESDDTVYLERVFSACLDMEHREYELISLHGSWARERHIQRRKIGYGKSRVESIRGESSHQDHPFIALVTPETTDEVGEVYGMHFIYSGNFSAQAEVTQFDTVRMTMGINPEGFQWQLKPGEAFQAPEVVMVYSSEGL